MVSQQKIMYVNNLYDIISKSKVIAIANVMDVPTSALQIIRKKLKEQGFFIKVVKKSLLIKTLEKTNNEKLKEMIKELENNKRITVALLIPKDNINPFLLKKILDENKSYRSARVGDVLDQDVVIKAGPTNFTPGPILTELKKFNIKTKVEGGKIVIAEDHVVAKKGDKVDESLASLLQKFNIQPIEVKLRLVLVYDGNVLYNQDILNIPLEKYVEDLREAFRRSIVLSVKAGIPTKENMSLLLKETYQNAIKLSLHTGIPTKENIELLLKIANNRALALKEKLNL